MKFQLIDEKSDFLGKVQMLGDQSSRTVGFLTRDAYFDYASRHCILAVTDGDNLLAYTMFRYKKNSIVIVHLCVSPECRGQNIPQRMIEWLLEQNRENISHLQLACRRDYKLDGFWEKLGFVAVAEKAGRATKDRTVLTIWVRENKNCHNLFSTISGIDTGKTTGVLDTNIVIDLCDESNIESNQLKMDYLGAYIDFRITRYVFTEINKSENESMRNKHRNYAQNNYIVLDNVDEDLAQNVSNDLLAKRPAKKHSNTWYDVFHIAQAVGAGAEIFVTRDGGWLNNSITDYIWKKYGLRIMSPGELVNSVDELESPMEYSPIKLAGLDLEYSKMLSHDFSEVVSTFFAIQCDNKSQFEVKLRNWISNPEKYYVMLVKAKGQPVSLVAYEKKCDSIKIETFLLNEKEIRPSLQGTFVKRVIFKLLDESNKMNMHYISFARGEVPEPIEQIIRACGFTEVGNSLLKVMDARIIQSSQLTAVASLPETNPINLAIERIRTDRNCGEMDAEQVISLEKALWPLKILKAGIPTYIVPIKADYAKELFDEKLSEENPSFFTNEKMEPALSIENVYFKSMGQSIPNAPARILWYVSGSRYMHTSAIRACSYLHCVEKGSIKNLYSKYRRIGVLSWDDLVAIGGYSGEAAAYIFSYTELFDYPVSIDDARLITGKATETFQSFRKINEQAFLRIYCQGKQGEKHGQ